MSLDWNRNGHLDAADYMITEMLNKELELENCRSKGDKHLVYETNSGLTRIYVLKWSELFDELLTRHEYLMDKLKFEEELWIKKHNSADETVEDLSDNSAQMKPAVV